MDDAVHSLNDLSIGTQTVNSENFLSTSGCANEPSGVVSPPIEELLSHRSVSLPVTTPISLSATQVPLQPEFSSLHEGLTTDSTDEESKSPFDLENSLDWHSVSAAATAFSLENFQNAHLVEHSVDTGNISPPPSVVDSVELHRQRFVRSVAGEIPRRRSFPTAQLQEVHESTNNAPTEHGAYEVVTITPFGSVPYEVPVPDKLGPGDEFAMQAGNRTVYVRIPADFELGTLEFTIDPDSITTYQPLKLLSLTASPAAAMAWKREPYHCRHRNGRIGGAIPMHGPIRTIKEAAVQTGKSVARTHIVIVPDNVKSGEPFQAAVEGFTFLVTCPADIAEDRRIRIVPPLSSPEPRKPMQNFRVQVPPGVKTGDLFTAVVDNGHEHFEVLVECPADRAGKSFTVSLPTQMVVGNIALTYD